MENKRCYAKISLKNLLWNFENLKLLTKGKCEIAPVIKADAYGHGALEIARALSKEAKLFAVAEINEALALREGGIENDILVLGYTDPSLARVLSENKITQTVTDLPYAEGLAEFLGDRTLGIHIKLNTGMNRLGFQWDCDKAVEDIRKISGIESLSAKGIFSHFAESDDLSSDFTSLQFSRFQSFSKKLEEAGLLPEICHICNSAATLTFSEGYLSMVRPGIILYGAYPSGEVKERYLSLHPDRPFKEVMSLVARVSQVHTVKKGECIGYNRTFKAERDMLVATVSAGYADGVPRYLSNCGKVTVNGRVYDIVGKVCMDLLMIDVTDSPVKVGDEVVFWGEDGLSVDCYADLVNTISYTLYTGVTKRVTRKYI